MIKLLSCVILILSVKYIISHFQLYFLNIWLCLFPLFPTAMTTLHLPLLGACSTSPMWLPQSCQSIYLRSKLDWAISPFIWMSPLHAWNKVHCSRESPLRLLSRFCLAILSIPVCVLWFSFLSSSCIATPKLSVIQIYHLSLLFLSGSSSPRWQPCHNEVFLVSPNTLACDPRKWSFC